VSSIRESHVYFTATTAKASWVLVPLLSLIGSNLTAAAQVVSAGDSTNTIVNVAGDRINISGGALSNDSSNLFQSFEQFDLTAEQTADFETGPTVQNIIGRVNGGKASSIDGALQVSGSEANLYLMNPAGVLIGPNAQLNLSGGFTATAATGIEFEQGQFDSQFDATEQSDYSRPSGDPTAFQFDTEQAGAVVNLGNVRVKKGQAINLIGGSVMNAGTLSAPEGTVTIAAVEGGNTIRIRQGDQLLSLEVEANALQKEDAEAIAPQNVLQSIPRSASRNIPQSIGEMLTGSGLSNATALVTEADGTVRLRGSGEAIASGTLSTRGETGGNINILGNHVLVSDAVLDASGNRGGGLIRIGGDYKGEGAIAQASHTVVNQNSLLLADALTSGNGGRIIVWANDTTQYSGHLSARGGLELGGGGFAEVSGKTQLDFSGTADMSAAHGSTGTLLLDPQNWVITDGIAPLNTATNSYISSAALENLSFVSDVVLAADDHITLENLFDDNLGFRAGSSITFNADADRNGVGAFVADLSDSITSRYGTINIFGAGITVGNLNTDTSTSSASGGDVSLVSSQGIVAGTISTNRYGNNSFSGNGGNITLIANGGDINVGGPLRTWSYTTGNADAGNGGDITLSAEGNITTGALSTVSQADNRRAGQGGNVTLQASNGAVTSQNIETFSSAAKDRSNNGGAIAIAANEVTILENLNSSSTARNNAGDGGNIELRARDRATVAHRISAFSQASVSGAGDSGSVGIVANQIEAGEIRAWSRAEASNSGRGGDVTLSEFAPGNRSSISVAEGIHAYSLAGNNNASAGGNLAITADEVITPLMSTASIADDGSAKGGNIQVVARDRLEVSGDITTFSWGDNGNATGNGGDVELSTNQLLIDSISTWTRAQSNSGRAGNVTISEYSPNGSSSVDLVGGIFAYSSAFVDNAGLGGSVVINADAITTGSHIETQSKADRDTASNGGSVILTAQNSIDIGGMIYTRSYAGNQTASNGGSVVMDANTIKVGDIYTQSEANSNAGNAGDVTLTANTSLTTKGILATGTLATGAGNGDIELTGDRIDINLTGSEINAISGESVKFQPASFSRNINIGNATEIANTLTILQSDIDAITDATAIEIGRSQGTGTVSLSPSIMNSLSTRAAIEILGGQTLRGPDRSTTFRLTGLGTGALFNANNDNASISFTNIESFVGGSQDDTFLINAALVDTAASPGGFNSIDGGGGVNTLSYAALVGTPLTVDLASLPIRNIQRLIGAGELSTLRGANSINSWRIDGIDTGIVNSLRFENFSHLAGGLDNDTFAFISGGSITGDLQGSLGTNSLDYRGYSSSVGFNLADFSATGLSDFSDIDNIIGSLDTHDYIQGSGGNDRFEMTGDRAGQVNGITFSGFESIEGAAGTDTLDYSRYSTGITVNLENNSATGLSSFNSIENIVGSAGTDRIEGGAGNDEFAITGERTGTINNLLNFSAIEQLNGGGGINRFDLTGLTSASETAPGITSGLTSGITIAGGSDEDSSQSNNRIVTNNANTTWQLDGKNRGLISQGNEVLAAFSEIQHLDNTSTSSGENVVLFTTPTAQITGSINSGTSNLSLIGDDINIGHSNQGDNRSAVLSGRGNLTIRPMTGSVGIELGGIDKLSPQVLNITDGEIAAIQEGFIKILIGGETHTGGITLGGDVSFTDSVMLRSQGAIDTQSNQLLVTEGNLLMQSGESIRGGSLIANRGSVTLGAQQAILIDAIAAKDGQGISLTSEADSVSVNQTLESSGEQVSGDINVTAAGAIQVGDIITSGGQRSGNVTLRSRPSGLASGSANGITAGGITTTNGSKTGGVFSRNSGSVQLFSPGSIQIEFIDARSSGNNTAPTQISIETQDNFSATGSVVNNDTGSIFDRTASISTIGAQAGNVQIRYGSRDRAASLFQVGTPSKNSTAFAIETPSAIVVGGDFLGSYRQDNIELINSGILPPAEPASRVPGEPVEVVEIPAAHTFVVPREDDSESTFQQIETRSAQEFENYLGSAIGKTTQIATLADIRKALENVEQATDMRPALLYVYFVPDAAAEEEVGNSRTLRPDDQLEVMLITQDGEPIRRRQWGVTRAQVDEASRSLRQQATSQFSTAAQYLPPAQQLYSWIIKPIEAALAQQGIDSLGFVMDTGLRTLPVAALHDGKSYLVESYSLGVLPSFSLTDIDVSSAQRIDFQNTKVLAMGASEFENQPDLPAVEAEVTLVSRGQWEGDAFLNEDFVLNTLQSQLKKEDYGVLHLATHAIFESGNLENSYIQLWDEKLSLNRISELSLDQEDIGLIILSACSTALGDQAAEYGFAGLAVSAGSQSALASLWPVSDEGTLGFMTQFYAQLKESSVRAEALRQAQIRMINGEIGISDGAVYGPNSEVLTTLPGLAESGQWDFSHPFYWSAFTMIGNPW
jgi:filamentous hemagglutinin family protein